MITIPYTTALTTYISYGLLFAFGQFRDFFRKIFDWFSTNGLQGYAPICLGLEDFYVRRLYLRIQPHCQSEPMLAGEKIIAEKITQLSDNASSIPRLGIPPYEWWSESLHGIAANGPGVSFSNGPVQSATMFSQVLLTAASFNGTLWYSIARATAVEARAMYNVGQAGLTFWAPNVNIFRDPRWGRGQETPGEDPMVASAFAIEYVKGLQGEDLSASSSGGLMLSACCKHFIGYDLENWTGIERYSFNAVITEQDAQDTYVPPFQSCIQDAKASCLMCSYNEVAGILACAMGSVFKKIRKFYNCYIIILSGNKVEKLCDLCNITVNKNAVFGDSSALAPGGVRIGAPAMTSRSLVEKDFEQIAELLHQAVNFCLKKTFHLTLSLEPTKE